MEITEDELALVKRIAKSMYRHFSGTIDLDDLVGEGNLAIVKAMERWKPDGGASLHTFLSHSIRGSMLDYARNIDALSRTHRKEVGASTQVTLAYKDLDKYDENSSRISFIDSVSSGRQDALSQMIDHEEAKIKKRRISVLTLNRLSNLTPSEMETVQLVAEGKTNNEIAKIRNVVPQAVKNTLFKVFAKTGITDRLKLALWFNSIDDNVSSTTVKTLNECRVLLQHCEILLRGINTKDAQTDTKVIDSY